MLPRINRLPAFEISTLMRKGKRIHGKGITLIYTSGTGRFCFIVSTKVDKRATVRNRMRRLMSESVRHQLQSMQLTIDGVFIGSKLLIGLIQSEIEKQVIGVFRNIPHI